jgi:hypothetical protein
LAAGPLAAWLTRASVAGRVAAAALWSLGMLLTLIGLRDPQRFYHQPNGVNNLVERLDDLLHVDLAGRLVAFQPFALAPRHERIGVALLALAALFATWFCIWVIPKVRDTTVVSGRAAQVSQRR